MISRVRLKEMMDKRGVTQSALAARVGVSQQAIGKLLTGESATSRQLHKIARELRTTPAYLTGETDDPNDGVPLPVPTADVAEELGLVPVKEVNLALGMGGGYLDASDMEEVVRYFPQHWLRQFTDAPPEKLVFARPRGDSMKPTIDDGDILLIDLRQNRINDQDRIWAIAVADIGMIKRIWANPDGSYKIKSDNPNVDPETAVDGEMFVLGQVVGRLGKL